MTERPAEPGELAPEYDDPLESARPSAKQRVWVGLALVAGVVAALGLVTWLIGIGPFGYRLFAYGNVTLYVYNGTPHFAHLDVDGAEFEVKPFSGQTLEVTGGDIEIETTLQIVETDAATGASRITETYEPLETKTFHGTDASPWLYHVANEESTCLAVTDLKSFYDGSGGDPEVIDTVFKDDRLKPLGFENVLFPQDAMPDNIPGELIWLAVVNCELLADKPELARQKIMVDAIAARRDLEKRRRQGRIERGLPVDD